MAAQLRVQSPLRGLWALLTCAAWGTTYYDQCQSSTTSTVVKKAPLVRASLVKRRYIKYLALPFLPFKQIVINNSHTFIIIVRNSLLRRILLTFVLPSQPDSLCRLSINQSLNWTELNKNELAPTAWCQNCSVVEWTFAFYLLINLPWCYHVFATMHYINMFHCLIRTLKSLESLWKQELHFPSVQRNRVVCG